MTNQPHDILKKFIVGELSPAARLEVLLPQQPDTSSLLLACKPHDYSASSIAKAVEDCDVQLLALSVTAMRDSLERTVVAVTVGASSADGVARSLERYGYEVINVVSQGDSPHRSRDIDRVNELLHYLEM